MNLTPHFTEEETGVSGQEQRIVDNYRFLARWILEPIRDYVKRPVIINSGYRPPAENAAVHGVSASEHMAYEDHAAVDFRVKDYALTELFSWIRLKSGLPFRQVILEYQDGEPACIHISSRRNGNDKREALIGETHNAGAYQRVEVA